MNELICALHKGTTAKLANSHVIPKALHMDVRGDDDHLLVLQNRNELPPTRSPTGEYDQIVCPDCERMFGPWDQYGVELMRQLGDGAGQAFKDMALIIDVDYEKMKLFVLSMLWRADASGRPMYRRIDLGEKWRECLRNSILEKDPGNTDFFAVLATRFRNEHEQQAMFDPHPEKYAHINYIRFYVYGGFTFLIKVDSRRTPQNFEPALLAPGKPLSVMLREWSPSEARAAQNILQNRQN